MSAGTKKVVTIKSNPKIENAWNVVLFNCYCHSFDEAVEQLIKSIGCGYIDASSYARTAERNGNVTVFTGDLSKCEKVARSLGSTGLMVTVAQ